MMQQRFLNSSWRWASPVLAGVVLSACGGGGSSNTPSKPQLAISGTAAIGAALPNANVQVKCLGGGGQTNTGADGSFKLQISAASLPCVLRVNDGRGRLLHSVAQDKSASAVANITPLTELLLTRSTRLAASSAFDAYSDKLAAQLSASNLQKAQTEVVSLLNGTLDTSVVNSFTSSPLKASSNGQPSGDPHDQLLDKLAQRVNADRFAELSRTLASAGPLPDPGTFKPELRLPAASLNVPVGATVALQATLNYPPNARHLRPPLAWSLVEADAGKLSVEGLETRYTAPSKKGVYHLKVVRDDYANVSASLSVNVIDFTPTLELRESSVTLLPGQRTRFNASYNVAPGSSYPKPPLSWKLLEADAGSIGADGVYTAGSKPGTYHLQLRRDDYPEKTQTAEIKVGSYQSLDRYATPLRYLGLTPERTLIRDASSWAAWKKAHRVDTQPQPEDEVDFSKHMIVAIIWPALQQCASATLLDLKPVTGSLQASVQIKPAPNNTACPGVVWTPVWLLATARSELPLSVVEK